MNKLFFVVIHLAALSALWTGASAVAVIFCLMAYLVRMFAITAGYHRLFSHRSYSTSRFFQFVLAFIGASSAQKGPLWWAASHRHHHKHSDTELDIHSPGIRGIWWAHVGWVISKEYDEVDLELVKDLTKYPELMLLEKYHYIPPLIFLLSVAGLGVLIEQYLPSAQTSMLQFFVWGTFVSTVLLYHATFAINSLTHVFGKRRFATSDQSRNSLILALITLGEGWHNNHHRYPGSERQGFYWWEIDLTHLVLLFLRKLGIVWNLRVPPQRIYDEALKQSA
jgi:stearoyl-CoA desaturase (delta-9 desaturase)